MPLSWKEISKFEKGQVFYENGYGVSVRYVLKEAPVLKEDTYLNFTGECENGEVDFMINVNYPHYGPDISYGANYQNVEMMLEQDNDLF